MTTRQKNPKPKRGRPYSGGRQKMRYGTIAEWAGEKGVSAQTAVRWFIEGKAPGWVGRLRNKTGRPLSFHQWWKMNGISRPAAERIRRTDMVPANVMWRGRDVLPTGQFWWEDAGEWARVATVFRNQVIAHQKLEKQYEKASKRARARFVALKSELTYLRRQADWFRFMWKRRQIWLMKIQRTIREGQKAQERGTLFIEGDHAGILARARKDQETREKISQGQRRYYEKKRQADQFVEPLTCAQIEEQIAKKGGIEGESNG